MLMEPKVSCSKRNAVSLRLTRSLILTFVFSKICTTTIFMSSSRLDLHSSGLVYVSCGLVCIHSCILVDWCHAGHVHFDLSGMGRYLILGKRKLHALEKQLRCNHIGLVSIIRQAIACQPFMYWYTLFNLLENLYTPTMYLKSSAPKV